MTSAGTVWRIVLGIAGIMVSFTPATQTSDSQSRLVEANEDEEFQAVVLPYSYLASMLIFLPREQSSLKEFEQSLNVENWHRWQSRFDSRMGTLGLPRLQMGRASTCGQRLKNSE